MPKIRFFFGRDGSKPMRFSCMSSLDVQILIWTICMYTYIYIYKYTYTIHISYIYTHKCVDIHILTKHVDLYHYVESKETHVSFIQSFICGVTDWCVLNHGVSLLQGVMYVYVGVGVTAGSTWAGSTLKAFG